MVARKSIPPRSFLRTFENHLDAATRADAIHKIIQETSISDVAQPPIMAPRPLSSGEVGMVLRDFEIVDERRCVVMGDVGDRQQAALA